MIYRVNVALTDMASLEPWALSLSLFTNYKDGNIGQSDNRHVTISCETNFEIE